MTAPPSPPVHVAADALSARLWMIVAAQFAFGVGWSTFLVQPRYLTEVLGANATQLGLASALGPLAGAASIPVGAVLIDRYGRRTMLVTGACLTLVAALGFATVERLTPLVYVLGACVGASFVFTFNGTIAMATDGAPPRKLGQIIGYIAAANMATNAVGTVTAEYLAATHGWRAVFLFAGSASLVALGMAARLGEARAPAGLPGDGDARLALRGPLGRTVAASMLTGGAFTALFTFVQPLALGLGARSVSPFFVSFTGAAVLVRVVFGGLGDRHGRLRVSLAALALYTVVTASGAALDPSRLWLLGAAFGLAHGVAYPTMNALAIERAPEAARGRAITLYNGAFNLGASVAAYTWGHVAERWGYASVFLPASGLVALAFVTLAAGAPRPAAR